MTDKAHDPLFDVTDKSIVIAGASGGLGRALTKALSDRGARLTLADIDEASLDQLAGQLSRPAEVKSVDVTDEQAATELIEHADKAHDGLDAVINATGVFSVAAAAELPAATFRRTLDVNVTGALLLSRAAAGRIGSAGGSIIHIASVSSTVANVNYAAYASSKAALAQLVRVLAREWAPRNIRVNAIGPAMTKTPLSAQHLEDPSFEAQALASIPMGRFGQPDDLLAPVLMLLGPGGSFVTGQTIYVDGGRTLA